MRDGRVRPDVRDLGDELREQTITLFDAGDRAAREKAISQVADRAFDLAFLSRLSNGAELGLDAHRGAQGEERGVKPRHGADALEDARPARAHALERRDRLAGDGGHRRARATGTASERSDR